MDHTFPRGTFKAFEIPGVVYRRLAVPSYQPTNGNIPLYRTVMEAFEALDDAIRAIEMAPGLESLKDR